MTSQLRNVDVTDDGRSLNSMCHTTDEEVGGTAHVTSAEKFPIKSRRPDRGRHRGGKRSVRDQLSSGNECRRDIRLERARGAFVLGQVGGNGSLSDDP